MQIITINVNGLRSKIGQVRKFLLNQQRETVLIINDTRLRGNLKSSDFPGYTIIKKDKPLIGTTATAGGVAFIFPKSWSCIEHDFKLTKVHFEALVMIIIPLNSLPIKLATCYNRPGNEFPQALLHEFNEIKFNGTDIPGIFTGDFNSPHVTFGSRLTNTYGSSLLQAITKHSLIHFNDKTPTYICSSSGEPNVLDLVLGNSLICPYILSCHVEGDIGSDHFPVVTLLDLNVKRVEIKPKVNFSQFVKKVDESLPSLCFDGLPIDDQVEMVEKVFKTSIKESTHKLSRPKRKLPHHIMDIIKERKSLLALRKRSATQDERAALTKEYNRINRAVKQQIQDYEEQQRKKLATDICEAQDSTKMWKLFKQYKNRNKECEKPIAPLELDNGEVAISNEERSAEFARHLKSVHQTPDNTEFDVAFKKEVDSYFTTYVQPPPSEDGIGKISVSKFRELLAQTKSNSSPGDDCITYDVMKRCSNESIMTLCKLINNCLSENIFPSKWKYAKIIMIPKPGKDPKKAISYRPISLLSCLGKIYERYVSENLLEKLEGKDYFAKVQAGYQKGKSSQEHLFRLTQDVYNGFKQRKATIGVFLDVQKAFDAVWTNGLKLKIKNIGLSAQLQNILFSFLKDRCLTVNVNGAYSDPVNLQAGTPQGSCLSPLLYIIFVNDLTSAIDQNKTSVSQYADDVGLYSTDRNLDVAKENVQSALDCVMEWCKRWQVIINAKKSQVVVYSKCPQHKKDVKLRMFGQVIPTSNEATYLGVIFDSRLTWEKQITKICDKAYGRLNLLRATASLSNKHNPTLLAKLYDATIKSIFEYSSVCIVGAASTHLEKLQLIQNEALRIVLKVPAYMPIVRMNDCANQINVKEFLKSVALRKVKQLYEKSSLVKNTVHHFRQLKASDFNTSPLDVIQLL